MIKSSSVFRGICNKEQMNQKAQVLEFVYTHSAQTCCLPHFPYLIGKQIGQSTRGNMNSEVGMMSLICAFQPVHTSVTVISFLLCMPFPSVLCHRCCKCSFNRADVVLRVLCHLDTSYSYLRGVNLNWGNAFIRLDYRQASTTMVLNIWVTNPSTGDT